LGANDYKGAMDMAFYIKFVGALFAIMNPFVILPFFLSLTEGQSPGEQRKTAVAVALYSVAMGVVIALAGGQILDFFGISVDSFRLAGGLVLLTIALGMLNGAGNTAHEGSSAEQAHHASLEQVAFYPITFPMIVGPGTITTLLVYRGQTATGAEDLAYWAALATALALLAVVLFFAGNIGKYLGASLRVVMTRLMGLVLAAIAVEMMAAGLKSLLPGLG
jgi:multiple antibiotic resistance protein